MLVNKPPMGWNTWNTFGMEPSEDLVKRSADAFIKLGLKMFLVIAMEVLLVKFRLRP